jgi:kinesin family protein 2/24
VKWLHQSILSYFFCWQDVASEPFEPSPFMPKDIDDDDEDVISGSQQVPVDNYGVVTSEKESTSRENNVAKIKVVVC